MKALLAVTALLAVVFPLKFAKRDPNQAAPNQAAPVQAAPVLGLWLLSAAPHPPADSYTQGLFFMGRELVESSGLYGRSVLFKRKLYEERRLAEGFTPPADCFAEGAALAEGEIYLLTWREGRGFVLDPKDLRLKREFAYRGEGWGLAWDGRRLWRSDGSSRLHPHRPGDFAPDGEPLTVRDGEIEAWALNELEWDPLTGLMLANVYGLDRVAAIDMADGSVRFWLDGAPLRALEEKEGLSPALALDSAMNGLALDGSSLWLTGKSWPHIVQAAWPPAGYEPAGALKDGAAPKNGAATGKDAAPNIKNAE